MKIEITEDEQVVLTRLYQVYYKDMYKNMMDGSNMKVPCDMHCENFMKTTIENLVMKIKFQK